MPSGTQCYRVLKMIGQQTLQLLEQIDTPALSHHLQEPAKLFFFFFFFFFLPSSKTFDDGIAAVSSPRHLERGMKSGLHERGSELLKGRAQNTRQSQIVLFR